MEGLNSSFSDYPHLNKKNRDFQCIIFTLPARLFSKFLLKQLLFSLHIDKIGKVITRDRIFFFFFFFNLLCLQECLVM